MSCLIEADHYREGNLLVAGGGDGSFEAAMGLAGQPGKRVMLPYRRAEFSRLRDRNPTRIEEFIRGKAELGFSLSPLRRSSTLEAS